MKCSECPICSIKLNEDTEKEETCRNFCNSHDDCEDCYCNNCQKSQPDDNCQLALMDGLKQPVGYWNKSAEITPPKDGRKILGIYLGNFIYLTYYNKSSECWAGINLPEGL